MPSVSTMVIYERVCACNVCSCVCLCYSYPSHNARRNLTDHVPVPEARVLGVDDQRIFQVLVHILLLRSLRARPSTNAIRRLHLLPFGLGFLLLVFAARVRDVRPHPLFEDIGGPAKLTLRLGALQHSNVHVCVTLSRYRQSQNKK
jgi:hypothetical protein